MVCTWRGGLPVLGGPRLEEEIALSDVGGALQFIVVTFVEASDVETHGS